MQHVRQVLLFSAAFVVVQSASSGESTPRGIVGSLRNRSLPSASGEGPVTARDDTRHRLPLPDKSKDSGLPRNGSGLSVPDKSADTGLPRNGSGLSVPDKSADTGLPCGEFFADGPSDKRKFALTFDDGPGAATKKLLKLLRKNDAKASFFMTGAAARRRPEIAAEVAESGNLVCNHTDSHLNFYRESIDASGRTPAPQDQGLLEREILLAEKSIEKATGIRTRFLRMPHGYIRDWVKRVAGRAEYVLVNWTYGSDWMNIPRDEMLEGYLKNLRPGAILLLHDGGNKKRKTTLWLVGKILAEAKEKKLVSVRLDELLGLEACFSTHDSAK